MPRPTARRSSPARIASSPSARRASLGNGVFPHERLEEAARVLAPPARRLRRARRSRAGGQRGQRRAARRARRDEHPADVAGRLRGGDPRGRCRGGPEPGRLPGRARGAVTRSRRRRRRGASARPWAEVRRSARRRWARAAGISWRWPTASRPSSPRRFIGRWARPPRASSTTRTAATPSNSSSASGASPRGRSATTGSPWPSRGGSPCG